MLTVSDFQGLFSLAEINSSVTLATLSQWEKNSSTDTPVDGGAATSRALAHAQPTPPLTTTVGQSAIQPTNNQRRLTSQASPTYGSFDLSSCLLSLPATKPPPNVEPANEQLSRWLLRQSVRISQSSSFPRGPKRGGTEAGAPILLQANTQRLTLPSPDSPRWRHRYDYCNKPRKGPRPSALTISKGFLKVGYAGQNVRACFIRLRVLFPLGLSSWPLTPCREDTLELDGC